MAGVGHFDNHRIDHWQVRGNRHAIIEKSGVFQSALCIVNIFFIESPANSLANAMPPLVAEFGLRFCFVFLFLSALSFLGLGIQPPTADWGSMVRDNATLISFGDITPLLPAMAIALLTIGVNFVVDWFLHQTSGLRDDH